MICELRQECGGAEVTFTRQARGVAVNYEAKGQLRVLKRIVRGLRLTLQTMNLSDEDRLVVRNLLRTARLHVKKFESNFTSSVNSPNPGRTSSSSEVGGVTVHRANQGSKTVVAAQFTKKSRKKKAHSQRASEFPDEWKKPWNEVSGGAFGLGKSRKH